MCFAVIAQQASSFPSFLFQYPGMVIEISSWIDEVSQEYYCFASCFLAVD